MTNVVENWLQRIDEHPVVDIIYNLKAVSKERPRSGASGHFYTPKKTQDFEKAIAAGARKMFPSPWAGMMSVKITIIEQHPKSWTPLHHELARHRLLLPTHGDLDNKVKAITDGLNGVAYHDDAQIARIDAHRRYGDKDMIVLTLRKIGLAKHEVEMALAAMKAHNSGKQRLN